VSDKMCQQLTTLTTLHHLYEQDQVQILLDH